jgi:hypothetical protein
MIYILSESDKKILSFASDILLELRTIRGIKVNNRRISANYSEYLLNKTYKTYREDV